MKSKKLKIEYAVELIGVMKTLTEEIMFAYASKHFDERSLRKVSELFLKNVQQAEPKLAGALIIVSVESKNDNDYDIMVLNDPNATGLFVGLEYLDNMHIKAVEIAEVDEWISFYQRD